MIQIILAFIAGVLTIAAPCILLPLPILLGGSVGQTSKTRPLFLTGGFVITFAVLGLTFNFLIRSFGLDPQVLRNAAVVLLIIFSFFLIWPTPFEKMMVYLSGLINRANTVGRSAGNGNFGGFIMGVVLGIIWTPCAGPILGSILTLIAQEQDLGKAALLLVSYALGAGVPMLAIAYGGQAVTTRVRGFAAYSTRLQQVFGIIMLGLAISIYFQYDTILQQKILEKFPILNGGIEQKLICKFSFLQTVSNKCLAEEVPSVESLERKSSDSAPTMLDSKDYLPRFGAAPEFVDIEKWLNSEPLTMASLRGKVILIDFWTYSCINCIRTMPYVSSWYEAYKDKGFVVVGVHTPEFAFEKVTSNVQTALKRHKIKYPVAQDNNYGTWLAFNNNYWPAHYLIDQKGEIRYVHFGEGDYEKTEKAIKDLLDTDEPSVSESVDSTQRSYGNVKTPEVYFGTKRLSLLTSDQNPSKTASAYSLPRTLATNKFALSGEWSFSDESAKLASQNGQVKMKFNAAQINMVAESKSGSQIKIFVDNKYLKTIQVTDSYLYDLFDSSDYREHEILLEIEGPGFEIFTFTFG